AGASPAGNATASDGASAACTGSGTIAGASSGRFQSSSVSAIDGRCGSPADTGSMAGSNESIAGADDASTSSAATSCSSPSTGGRFQSSSTSAAAGSLASSPSIGGRFQSSVSGDFDVRSRPSTGVTLQGSSSDA